MAMTRRERLHGLVDELAERDLEIAERVLAALRATAAPVLRALLDAPVDDEPESEEERAAAEEEAREAWKHGEVASDEELRREMKI